MDVIEVIIAKRDGGALSTPQIDWVIDAYTRGVVADDRCRRSTWPSCSTA